MAKIGKKCPECLSCFDVVWVGPRRVFHCWFCGKFYDILDNKAVEIDVEAVTGVPKKVLDERMERYGTR